MEGGQGGREGAGSCLLAHAFQYQPIPIYSIDVVVRGKQFTKKKDESKVS